MPAQIRASTAVRSVNRDGSHPGPARLSCQSEVKATKFARNWESSEESRLIACVTIQIESLWLTGSPGERGGICWFKSCG